MKFKFRLQSVYDLRQHLESEQKDALTAAQQKLNELVAAREELNGRFDLWSKKYLALAREGMSPIDAVRIGKYLDDLGKGIMLASRQVEKQEAEVEKERLLLIEKMKDRKTMESLYDKQNERFIYDEGKKDEKEIEDLISSRR
jgi:flagellar protein FliJ